MKKLLPLLLLCFAVASASAQDFKPYFSNNINFGMSYTNGQIRQSNYGSNGNDLDFLGLQFNYIGLVHLSPRVAVGAGTGIRHLVNVGDYWEDWYDYDDFDFIHSYFSVPLYAHAQFRFMDRKVSPFLNTSLGYHFRVGESEDNGSWRYNTTSEVSSISSGLLGSVQAGVSIHVGRRFNIMAGPYFEYRQATLKRSITDYSSASMTPTVIENDLNLFEAGLKVGFAF